MTPEALPTERELRRRFPSRRALALVGPRSAARVYRFDPESFARHDAPRVLRPIAAVNKPGRWVLEEVLFRA